MVSSPATIVFVFAIYVAALPTTTALYHTSLAFDSFELRVGTTASFQGQYVRGSMDAYQGLKLTEEVINSQRMFKTRDDGNITVNLAVFDDESSPSKTAQIFQEMVDSKDFDFFIGPFSSTLSREAISVTENAYPEQLLMLHAAADPGMFGNTNWVFATNPLAPDYFANGLEQLHNLVGARTVTFVRSPGPFHRNMCDGAKQHAIRLNYKIIGEYVLFGTDVIDAIRASRDAHADVFVACCHLSAVITIAMTSKALMFSPRAMLMSHGTSQGFIDAVGAKNANYILGPVSWDKEVTLPCRVFGNSENFDMLYRQRWGMHPTQHSASASSALITLMLATEMYAQSQEATPGRSPVPNDVIWNLRNKEFPTFAANLRFHRNGTRHWPAFPLTKQIVPDSLATSPMERYMQSEAVLVTEERPPLYPAPTWDQRELEVYPCPQGTVLSQMTCELCPIGKARNSAGLACHDCEGSFYGDKFGLSECIWCKRGMKCNGSTEFAADQGFYRLRVAEGGSPTAGEDGEYSYHECDPPELCFGSNRCTGHNIGVLCAQCSSGYTNRLAWGDMDNLCTPCPNTVSNLFWFLGAILIYIVSITVVSLSDRASSKSLSAVHGVIIKIVINYAQFMSTIFAAADFRDLNSAPVLKSLVQFVCSPLKPFLILDCFSDKLHVRPENTTILLGWMLIPIGLSFSWLFFALLTCLHLCCKRHRKNDIVHQEKPERTASVDGEDENDDDDVFGDLSAAVEGAVEGVEELADEAERKLVRQFSTAAVPQTQQSDQDIANVSPSKTIIEQVSGNRAQSSQSGNFWSLMTKAVDPHQDQRMDNHLMSLWIRTAIISIFLLYPVALEMLISGVACRRVDHLRLASNLDVTCHEGDHIGWFYASLGGMIVYGLGVPFIIFQKLFVIRNDLLDIHVRRTYGFLYNGFELQYYYFEVFYMVRKFLMILASAIPDIYARIMIMLWMALAFMAIQLVCRPWDNRAFFIFDKLETLNLLVVLLSLALRLIFEIRKDIVSRYFKDAMQHDSFTVVGWLFCSVAHVAFWLLAISSLVRNTIIRHLQFKRRVFPDSLSPIQKSLCRLADSRNNTIHMHPLSHELVLEDISFDEKYMVTTALSDTLEQYIIAGKNRDRFCLEYMWGAMQDTFIHYEQIHKRKVEQLMKSKRMRQYIGDDLQPKMLTAKDGLTVEEFQVALMASWPGIAKGDDKYFVPFTQYDQSERLNAEAQAHDLVWAKDMPLTHMLDILQRREELLAAEDQVLLRPKFTPPKITRTQDMDAERVLSLVGMEDARREVMSSTLTSKVDDFGNFELLLKDYEAKYEEMLSLTMEAVYLRDLCVHRVHQQVALNSQLSQRSKTQQDPVFADAAVLLPRDCNTLESDVAWRVVGTVPLPVPNDATASGEEEQIDAGLAGRQLVDTGVSDLPTEMRRKAGGKSKPQPPSSLSGQPTHPLQMAFCEKAHPLSSAFVSHTSELSFVSADAGTTDI